MSTTGFFPEYATQPKRRGRRPQYLAIAAAIDKYLHAHGRQRWDQLVNKVCRRFLVSPPTARKAITHSNADLSRWGWVLPPK